MHPLVGWSGALEVVGRMHIQQCPFQVVSTSASGWELCIVGATTTQKLNNKDNLCCFKTLFWGGYYMLTLGYSLIPICPFIEVTVNNWASELECTVGESGGGIGLFIQHQMWRLVSERTPVVLILERSQSVTMKHRHRQSWFPTSCSVLTDVFGAQRPPKTTYKLLLFL